MRLRSLQATSGFRALGLFWAGFLTLLAVGAATLQALGPARRGPEPSRATASVPAAAEPAARPAGSATPPSVPPGRAVAGPIAAADPALLEPSKDYPGAMLPRVAADGRTPSQVYARGFEDGAARPRIGILLAGVGPNASDSEDAIRSLPGEISLAFSPYTAQAARLVDAARSAGHEVLISLPMEPHGYPLNDAGDHALLTGASPEQNRLRLDWALGRIEGYVGATGALGLLHGERFAASSGQFGPMLQSLASRGLLYVDPRPGRPTPKLVWGRTVDLVIDEPAVRSEIEAKLAALEQIARDKGSALGLAGAVRPVTVDRVAAWSTGLAGKGLALAPVSALVVAPRTRDAAR